MIQVELLNVNEFVAAFSQKYPQQVRLGTAEGVHLAGEALADDVSEATPYRTGKAAAFVRNRQTAEATAVIDYDPKEAFYMRFVQLGAKPHPILPRGLSGSKEQRRLSAYARRHSGQYQINWPEQMSTGDWFSRLGGKRKKALFFGGHFYSHVNHPGIQPNKILVNRLMAMQDKLSEIIRTTIEAKVNAVG